MRTILSLSSLVCRVFVQQSVQEMLLMLHRGCLSALRSCYFCAHAISGFFIFAQLAKEQNWMRKRKTYKKAESLLLQSSHAIFIGMETACREVCDFPPVPWPTSITKTVVHYIRRCTTRAVSMLCGRSRLRSLEIKEKSSLFVQKSLFELVWMLGDYTIMLDNILAP